jgi:alpha-1,3-rhamnosyl/mannosyltransferase
VVDLVVVSDSQWTPEERQRLSKSDVESRISLLQDVDDEHLRRLYGSALAFVYPSLYEGFGIPLLEAMACGCPVIASDIVATREVAGDCPLYFEPSRYESLISALDLALNESDIERRRTAGLARVNRFSWDETAHRTLEVYRSL